MQKKIFITITAVFITFLANAQFSADYHLGRRYFYSNDSALVRFNSDTSLLLYYHLPYAKEIAYIRDDGSMRRTSINTRFSMHDMAVTGNYLFLCGKDHLTGNAVLGSMKISSGAITFHVIDIPTPYNGSCFTDIVAYQTSPGVYKVVLLGYSDYYSSGYPCIIENNCPSALSNFVQQPNYSTYTMQFVMEIVTTDPFSTPSTCSIKAVRDRFHNEILHDVVLTDNYVSFIGMKDDQNQRSLTIHRCSRNAVLADFDSYYYYPYASEKYFWLDPIGCQTKEDTLAIAALGDDMGQGYSTQIRLFDLASMDMTVSQMFTYKPFKPFPLDLIYTPSSQTLILLQYAEIPGTIDKTVFYNLKPYNANPTYMIQLHYDNNIGDRSFFSMDRHPDGNHFASSGGDYLFLKKSTITNDNATCYNTLKQLVYNYQPTLKKQATHKFISCTVNFVTYMNLWSFLYGTLATECIE